MKVTRRTRRQGPLIHALYLNAGLLLAILGVLLVRGNGPGLTSPAFGAPQMAPIAGGGGVFLMPAQFSINTWGCYLMDIDTQNICAYQYFPSERQLRFVAARNYREDRKLPDWNTSPHPAEIAHLNELQKSEIRGAAQGTAVLPPLPTDPAPPAPSPDSPPTPQLAPDPTVAPGLTPAVPSTVPTTVPSTGLDQTVPGEKAGTTVPGNPSTTKGQ